MKKTDLLKILALVPDDSDIVVEFSTDEKYPSTYQGVFTGINIDLKPDGAFNVLVRVKEVTDTTSDAVPF